MLAYLIEWARQTSSIWKINLRVRVDNLSALHLYEKYGFMREGSRIREFYLHGQFVDVFLMGLQLAPLDLPSCTKSDQFTQTYGYSQV